MPAPWHASARGSARGRASRSRRHQARPVRSPGRSRVHGALPDDLAGITVRFKPLVRRLADVAVPRPAADLGADHQLRACPSDAGQIPAPAPPVVLRRRGVEGRCIRPEIVEPLPEHRPGAPAEARPDLAGKPEVLALVHADHERAELLRAPLSRRPPADDQLLLRSSLDLEPGRRAAAGLVPAAPVLGDDALEALGPGGLEECHALGLDRRRDLDPGRGPDDQPEEALALLERDIQQRLPVEVEQVECLEHERDRPPGPAGADPLLQQAEVRPTVVVERDHLAVHDGLARLDPRWRRQEAREVGLRVVAVAREQTHLAVADDGLHAVPVPLDLEQPVLVTERLRGQGREHRLDVARHRSLAGAGQVDLRGRGRVPR